MYEYEIVKTMNEIKEIDRLLLKNKEIIDIYAGAEVPVDSDIAYLCHLTKLLMIERIKLKNYLIKLLKESKLISNLEIVLDEVL